MSGGSPQIFLSYRRAETQKDAGWLHSEMTAAFGPDSVFIDADLKYAEDFVRQITKVLNSCTVMVVVIGPDWATIEGDQSCPRLFDPDDVVRYEIETALGRSDVKVLPVLVGGAGMPRAAQLPESLREIPSRHAAVLSDSLVTRREEMRRLLETLRAWIAGKDGKVRRDERSTASAIAQLLAQGVVVAAVAGALGGLIGGAIDIDQSADDVKKISQIMIQRSMTWASVGAALSIWLTMARAESRGLFGRALAGLLLGALAGAAGGAIFGAAVHLPTDALEPETRQQIQIGAIAATGGLLGSLLGRLWIPPRAGPGFLAGAAGGALAQVILREGEWGLASSLEVGFRCIFIATLAIATLLALDALSSEGRAPAGVRPAT